jgi:hypothetical protein
MVPPQVSVLPDIGLVIARLLPAVRPVTPQGEANAAAMPCSLHVFSAVCSPEAVQSVAVEHVPSSARAGRNRPRRSSRHVPRGKAGLLGVNFGQTEGTA